MRIWIFEANLMWSSRLVKTLTALGHEAKVVEKIPEGETADIAILNLGSHALPAADLAPKLKAIGVKTLAHAGHKETELLELGRNLGIDRLATNSELTFKIEAILAELSPTT
jgi:hypothetical protein